MAKFINPFTDVGFKRIFGQEINKDLLIDFLNALLAGERQVKDIQFLDKELLPVFEKDRGLIYDVYCTDESGEQFIVEMQNKEHANFRERTLYYLSQAISRQGEKGLEWKFDLKAVYGVFFLNFSLTDFPHKLRTDIVLADRDTHELFTDKMRYIFIELPSFTKEEDDCVTDFERWIYVLKNMETLQRLPFKARNAVFKKLEQSIKVYRDQLVTLEYQWQQGEASGFIKGEASGFIKGKAEGLAQGKAEGLAQGKAEGLAQGKEEERFNNARGMKAASIAPDLIAQITGLSLETIEGL